MSANPSAIVLKGGCWLNETGKLAMPPAPQVASAVANTRQGNLYTCERNDLIVGRKPVGHTRRVRRHICVRDGLLNRTLQRVPAMSFSASRDMRRKNHDEDRDKDTGQIGPHCAKPPVTTHNKNSPT